MAASAPGTPELPFNFADAVVVFADVYHDPHRTVRRAVAIAEDERRALQIVVLAWQPRRAVFASDGHAPFCWEEFRDVSIERARLASSDLLRAVPPNLRNELTVISGTPASAVRRVVLPRTVPVLVVPSSWAAEGWAVCRRWYFRRLCLRLYIA
jgi:hypothetical protein